MFFHNSILQSYFSIAQSLTMKTQTQARRLQPNYNEQEPQSPDKSQQDDSRQTYTALVFNQNDKERSYYQKRGRYSKYIQGSALKDKNQPMSQLLKINSISKLISSKEVKESVAIFANVKLNMSVDKKNKKVNQRPASAFTKVNKQRYQIVQIETSGKDRGNRMVRELSLSGKNCLEEPTIKLHTKEDQIQENSGELQPKFNENTENYGYIAKSRLISSKQPKKSMHVSQQKEQKKKSMYSESAISFQSLYNNLLINNKAVQDRKPAKQRYSHHHFSKKHKNSFHNPLKNQQNTDLAQSMTNTLIVASKQRKTTGNLGKQQSFYLSRGSFHKNHSKTLLTSQILKSLKKGKGKITRILRLKKQEIIEPQLVIENIQVSKNEKRRCQKPLKKSLAENHCNISHYLSTLSANTPIQNPGRRQQNCQLEVGCKRVAYT